MNSVLINDQEWAGQNLNVKHFRNGDPVPEAQSYEEWEQAAENKTPAWCYYDEEELNGEEYGILYNWYAVSDPRGLAPEGWEIPGTDDWEKMADFLGDGHAFRLRSDEMWVEDGLMGRMFGAISKDDDSNDSDDEDRKEEDADEIENTILNDTGFDAEPGGARGRFGNAFYALGDSAYWWTSTEFSEDEADFILLYYHNDYLQIGGSTDKKAGHAIRCIRQKK